MHLLVILLTGNMIIQKSKACPPPDDIKPCTCSQKGTELELSCTRINDNQLLKVNRRLNGILFSEYEIILSNINRITNGTFQNVSAKRLRLASSRVDSFELFSGLHGLQDTLEQLLIFGIAVRNWTFSSGEEFHKLYLISIMMSGKEEPVPNRLFPVLPTSLTEITMGRSVIQFQDDANLKKLKNLATVQFISANLSSVKRSYLPIPASELKTYEILNAPLTFLPDDMFTQMPKLEMVGLKATPLMKLHYHIFKPVFRQLKHLVIDRTQLICDCDAAWLLMNPQIWSEEDDPVICSNPTSLKGQKLETLAPIQLCFNCNEHKITS